MMIRKSYRSLWKTYRIWDIFTLFLDDNKTGVLKGYINGSFAIHNDMKSHIGINLTMGKRTTYGGSIKHKLNTKSLTVAKPFNVNYGINQFLWTKYFLECQGDHFNSSTIYQDNKASILLEGNGKMFSSKRTSHINISYFFITNKVRNKEVDIECMLTEEITANYFTKPLQGILLCKIQNQIKGINEKNVPL